MSTPNAAPEPDLTPIDVKVVGLINRLTESYLFDRIQSKVVVILQVNGKLAAQVFDNGTLVEDLQAACSTTQEVAELVVQYQTLMVIHRLNTFADLAKLL